MRALLILSVFLVSLNASAYGVVDGKYNNEQPECSVRVKTEDFFRDKDLKIILSFGYSSFMPWGADLMVSFDSAIESIGNTLTAKLDNDIGGVSYIEAEAHFHPLHAMQAYILNYVKLNKMSAEGEPLGEELICDFVIKGKYSTITE